MGCAWSTKISWIIIVPGAGWAGPQGCVQGGRAISFPALDVITAHCGVGMVQESLAISVITSYCYIR